LVLATLQKDKDHVMRFRAADALEAAGKAAARYAGALKDVALNDKFAGVRQSAARALGKMGQDTETCAQDISAELESGNDPVRRKAAAQALASVLPKLGENDEICEQFEAVLSKHGNDVIGIEIDKDYTGHGLPIVNVKAGLIEKWNKQNPERAINAGLRIVSVNEVREPNWSMTEELKRTGSLKLVISRSPVVVHAGRLEKSALLDGDDFVRLWSRKALGTLGRSFSQPHAKTLASFALEDGDAIIRSRAAEALCEFGHAVRTPHAAAMASMLQNEDPTVQHRAAKALERLGSAAVPHHDALRITAQRARAKEVRMAAGHAFVATGGLRSMRTAPSTP